MCMERQYTGGVEASCPLLLESGIEAERRPISRRQHGRSSGGQIANLGLLWTASTTHRKSSSSRLENS